MASPFPFWKYDDLLSNEVDFRNEHRDEIKRLIGFNQLTDALDECAAFCNDVEGFEGWIVAAELFARTGQIKKATHAAEIVVALLEPATPATIQKVQADVLAFYGLVPAAACA